LDRFERCGFAGAVGTEQRDDLAVLDLERDTLEDQDDVIVDDLDVVDGEVGCGRCRVGCHLHGIFLG